MRRCTDCYEPSVPVAVCRCIITECATPAADIKKFETAIVDNEGPPKSNFALPDSGAGKAQVLLETKVQRMEHLVYTLKKRVNKYENCVDDRSDTAKFDSKEV